VLGCQVLVRENRNGDRGGMSFYRHQVGQGFRAVGFSLPMRPLGPTTKGRERAFQFWSASGASVAFGLRGRQFLPWSVEMSVPLGPTVIQVLVVGS
jgi:hypothetical protein